MIIKREYVTFRRLINSGDKGGKLFVDILKKYHDEEMQNAYICALGELCLYQREMDWALMGIDKLIEGFHKLDEEEPFDNGYTLDDVNDVDIVWKDEESIVLHLVNKFDDVSSIIKVVEIAK